MEHIFPFKGFDSESASTHMPIHHFHYNDLVAAPTLTVSTPPCVPTNPGATTTEQI